MACMCGDLYCHSCGPAQGNYHCANCGAWAADGGCESPVECRKAEKAFAEAEYEQWCKDERDAAEYFRTREVCDAE